MEMDIRILARLRREHDDLKARVEKLETFMTTKEFENLYLADIRDLREQLGYMKNYLIVLARRLSRQAPAD